LKIERGKACPFYYSTDGSSCRRGNRTAVLVGTAAVSGVAGWRMIGMLLNGACFMIAALVYVVMFARCFA
jgi:hypothetical protein